MLTEGVIIIIIHGKIIILYVYTNYLFNNINK